MNNSLTWRGRLAHVEKNCNTGETPVTKGKTLATTGETPVLQNRSGLTVRGRGAHATSVHATVVFMFIALFASSGGCAHKSPQLKVYPTDSLPFIQKFPRAYLGKNDAGDDEIVMISEGLQTPPHQGKILYPTNVGSIRQIVHIRILWKPLPGTRTDQPTATNATITWYVRSNMPGGENDKIDYGGAGFVNFYPNKTGARIVVRNASLALRQSSGEMQDPFGKPSISGTFDVIRNDGLVRDTLATLRTRVAAR